MMRLKMMAGAAAREDWRWAARHRYALLVLSPLVLGMTYFGIVRLVEDHPEISLSAAESLACAVSVFAVLVVLSLSRANVEIYHVRRAEMLFDTLPVPVDTHLYAALLRRLGRASAAVVAALVARRILGGSLLDVHLLWGVPLLAALLAVTQVLAAVEWIHWEHRRELGAGLAALAALASCAVAGGLLLLTIVRPDRLPAWGRPGGTLAGVAAGGVVLTVAAFFLVRRMHRSWRAADMEYARRLRAGASRSFFGARWLRRLDSTGAAAALARDLQLTVRAFSSAVYVSAGLAALWIVLLVAVLTTGVLPAGEASSTDWFEATWLPAVMAVKVACVFVTATLGALLPVLVAYQLPHLWLERATGATGAEVWRAKLWYTRLISAPAPLAVWATGVATGEVPLFYVLPLAAECAWIWWLVSTLMGLFAFEMPEQPGLAMVLMGAMGLALGFGAALMWPAGLMLYAFGMRELMLRGAARAAYRLHKEGD